MSLQFTLAHQWPSFPSTKQSLPSWRDQQDPRQCLDLVDAARNAQAKLRERGLSLDERAMPRERNSPSRELDWMAEAAMRGETLFSCAPRLSQLEAVENAFWLTANEGPECVPPDDFGFRISTKVQSDLPVMPEGLCQHLRRQKQDGLVGARCLAQLDEYGQHAQKCLIGGRVREVV